MSKAFVFFFNIICLDWIAVVFFLSIVIITYILEKVYQNNEVWFYWNYKPRVLGHPKVYVKRMSFRYVDVQLKFITTVRKRLLAITLTLKSYNWKYYFPYKLTTPPQRPNKLVWEFQTCDCCPIPCIRIRIYTTCKPVGCRLYFNWLVWMCFLIFTLSFSVAYIYTYTFEIEEKLLVMVRELFYLLKNVFDWFGEILRALLTRLTFKFIGGNKFSD